MTKDTKRIAVTGAAGQIGSELILRLRQKYGKEKVLATDIIKPNGKTLESGPYELLNVTQPEAIASLVRKFKADTVYHMAAILSATGEKNPKKAWDVNINGTLAVLEVARELGIARVFAPSSIAVFGPATPRYNAPQDTVLDPATMYGVTKVAGEYLCDYYVRKYGLDIRGCRYPGIISYETLPGGGTTDYAVAIFYEAVLYKRYTCFLKKDTRLPMMYMPDCLKATLDLMEADYSKLKHHSNFNVAAMSFSAGELAAEIKKHIPDFVCNYKPDFRQPIAETWPASVDDSAARQEWGWKPKYDLATMTEDMLKALQKRKKDGTLRYPRD